MFKITGLKVWAAGYEVVSNSNKIDITELFDKLELTSGRVWLYLRVKNTGTKGKAVCVKSEDYVDWPDWDGADPTGGNCVYVEAGKEAWLPVGDFIAERGKSYSATFEIFDPYTFEIYDTWNVTVYSGVLKRRVTLKIYDMKTEPENPRIGEDFEIKAKAKIVESEVEFPILIGFGLYVFIPEPVQVDIKYYSFTELNEEKEISFTYSIKKEGSFKIGISPAGLQREDEICADTFVLEY
ncbi:MAG TPA: hypothetical protein ENG16_01835 [Archaeoglobus sp.]|nr:hypothetical protein [Archaeoglobus sp.]